MVHLQWQYCVSTFFVRLPVPPPVPVPHRYSALQFEAAVHYITGLLPELPHELLYIQPIRHFSLVFFVFFRRL